MTQHTLEVQDADGVRRRIHADAVAGGFTEADRYLFSCADDLRLVIDDVELTRDTDGFHWSAGFYAGQVTAELLNADGVVVARFRLDVSPEPNKLGQALFDAMLRDLADLAPILLVGSGAHQSLFDPDQSSAPTEVQYVRLIRYADESCRALQRVCDQPLTRLTRERHLTEIHRLRRLDMGTARAIALSPLAVAIVTQSSGMAVAASHVDAPMTEPTLDNGANRTLARTLQRLQHRVAYLLDWQNSDAVRRDDELAPKCVRRKKTLLALQTRLGRIARREPFCSVTRRVTSADGLTAIAAHPAYARAQRHAWLALQDGVGSADAVETLPISPTWQVYERWCYLCVTEVMRTLFPQIAWQQTQWGNHVDQLKLSGEVGGRSLTVWLQPRFAPWDQPSQWQRNSLSGERFPDIVITLEGAGVFAFMVLDAKYRASRLNVLDAMASAHLYHDSLTWHRKRPWRALLLVPRTDKVPWLAEPRFQETYGVGAIEVAQRSCTAAIQRVIAAFLADN